MTIFGFLAGARVFLFPAGFALAMILIVGSIIYEELGTQRKYREEYGEVWQAQYEKDHGPLSHVRTKLLIGPAGALLTIVITVMIYRQMMPEGRIQPSRRKRRR